MSSNINTENNPTNDLLLKLYIDTVSKFDKRINNLERISFMFIGGINVLAYLLVTNLIK